MARSMLGTLLPLSSVAGRSLLPCTCYAALLPRSGSFIFFFWLAGSSAVPRRIAFSRPARGQPMGSVPVGAPYTRHCHVSGFGHFNLKPFGLFFRVPRCHLFRWCRPCDCMSGCKKEVLVQPFYHSSRMSEIRFSVLVFANSF